MEIVLAMFLLFEDGTRVQNTIVVPSYDACYVKGLQQVDKFEQVAGVVRLEMECIKKENF